MPPIPFWLGLALMTATPAVEPAHEANPAYREVLGAGLVLDGTKVILPSPILTDGMSADAQRQALEAMAGSAKKVEDLLRDSVSAPFILKVRDIPSRGGTIRAADLWFAVHADLAAVDPAEAAQRAGKGEAVEAGNMRFASRGLDAEERKSMGLPDPSSGREWSVRLTGRLLDRIEFEAVDRVAASRSEESLVVASRTLPGGDGPRRVTNRWWPVSRKGGQFEPGPSAPYEGGGSYAKISALKAHPGALLVEAHFAFSEPREWFDGAPILRSKIGLVAQDQIRRLRREIARGKPGQGDR
jgi:hypothetical protein